MSQLSGTSPNQRWFFEVLLHDDESKPEYQLEGLWPTDGLRAELDDAMVDLLTNAPARASLRARIEKLVGGYRMQLTLTHHDGVMRASEMAPNARKAWQRTMSAMQAKLHGWRLERSFAGDTSPPRVNRRYGPRVLIVDDNPISVKLIEACLAQLGCETSVVTTGREAVREMTAHDYDLLVLDWMMPGMNGADTLRTAQEMISYDANLRLPWIASQLPVVTYSGQNVETMGIPDCANFDVVGHISKMATYPEIRRLTTSILGELRSV